MAPRTAPSDLDELITEEELIRNVPAFHKPAKELEWAQSVRELLALKSGPIFAKAIYGDLTTLETQLQRAEKNGAELEEDLGEITFFNRTFIQRGWIYYERLDLELVEEVNGEVVLYGLESAEMLLLEHYSEATVRLKLNLLKSIKSFRPRLPIARKALEDYAAGRYYACVPVVLTLIDGLVRDLHPDRRGFFAEGTELTAHDSIATHDRGLVVLARLFSAVRVKTSTEPLAIPYYNGILHGFDLGYDNKLVAAKAWALLFAVRDWALIVQETQQKASTRQPKATSKTTAQA